MANTNNFIITGKNKNALFSLKAYRGEGMMLLAMNWKQGNPPNDFVGFSIEYKEPNGDRFFAIQNRIAFEGTKFKDGKKSISSLLAPIQLFRWIHFPMNPEKKGEFLYKVKPVFMSNSMELSYGEKQEIAIELNRETYEGKVNVTFTRGFISSQAFVDRYNADNGIQKLLPTLSKEGLDFTPVHPKANEALAWMGFEARNVILKLLDDAINDTSAQVKVIAYDLNLPEMVEKLAKLENRLSIIIDDSKDHKEHGSAENKAYDILSKSTNNIKRQHMGQLQHNKTIIVEGNSIKAAVYGSTNFSWRGFYVQANNAVIVYGEEAIKPFKIAFENYFTNEKNNVKAFGKTTSATWNTIDIPGIDIQTTFSPHSKINAVLDHIANDVSKTESSLFYSLAFLSQTQGGIRDIITTITNNSESFVYGMADKKIGGFELRKPDGTILPVYPSELSKNLPEPFISEPKGGRGNRMHHKFIVIDFDKPTARVYLGSYNFSLTADTKNGENLLLIKDQKIATSYMIEALRIFDHYHFRLAVKESKKTKTKLILKRPPTSSVEKTWWEPFYTNLKKIKDRELFS